MALLLAVLGIYGLMAFLVAQRTQEIGLRIALGAGRIRVLQMVIGEGLRLATIGLVLGFGGAWAVGRGMQTMLYEAKPVDITAYLVVASVLLVSAVPACCVPARRAAWADPVVALREN